tara:strand:+ start:4071 stop:6827 length:2757 start_codon:yes stop_codon:yes gene_type:complete
MSNPLQGSLFGESIEINATIKTSENPGEDIPVGISDEELTQDALARPRAPKKTKIESRNSDSPHKGSSCQPQENTQTWSNHSDVSHEKLTPMLRHYVELKKENPQKILLYRLGDFYECFFEDAIKLSQLLELTLTGKEGGKSIGRVPMAGIPHHAAERYCAEIIKKGLCVAICDQLETSPSQGNLLRRGITRVLTPGTVIEEGMLQARRNNWLAAVVIEKVAESKEFKWGLACADVSTGELIAMERVGINFLHEELSKLEAAEVICKEYLDLPSSKWCPRNSHITHINKSYFNELETAIAIKEHYKIKTIDGLGIKESPMAIISIGSLILYLKNTNPATKSESININSAEFSLDIPILKHQRENLILDSHTRRNLEITSTQKDGQFHGSLLWAIDNTLTAMGGRNLRRWVEEPLIKKSKIIERQSIISELVKERELRKKIRNLLRAMGDLERLAGRASAGQAGARDLMAIAEALRRLPFIQQCIQELKSNGPSWLQYIAKENKKLESLCTKIKYYLVENPPLSLTEGGIIQDGVDNLLDGIRNQLDDQDNWLKNQENIEKENSKINNLKLQYHRTFGYFLSVSKSKANSVPEHWIRRQTLANEERFITPILKEREGKIFQLKARSAQKEYELFCDLREYIGTYSDLLRSTARSIAGLDTLAGLAEVAATQSYCAPEIKDIGSSKESNQILIKNCRHPVVEIMLAQSVFQPNNVDIGLENDLLILTGPNASGKSCYLRQIGLVQLLGQIGSWVPAEKASLSISDQIFTRVGAVDDLSSGQSTFMVEMAETAYILNQATSNSLILLDEIGRGTATYDGLSIAWSVSEYLAKNIKSKTIFATHYHELNELTKVFKNISNIQVLVKETGNELIFLHKISEGGSDKSYGIEAARLAGVPQAVIERSKELLNTLQKKTSINFKN